MVYDHLIPQDSKYQFDILPSWVPDAIRDDSEVREYLYQAKNIVRHIGYQARGQPSGVHGLFHQYVKFEVFHHHAEPVIRFRIDAFTIFALPATGPHGFHTIGRSVISRMSFLHINEYDVNRTVESLLRTMNNLLERLHASFFFYILTAPERFLKIGSYLPSVILISVAMMFGGLRYWVDAGWVRDISPESDLKKSREEPHVEVTWMTRRRPVLRVLGVMAITHAIGVVLFFMLTTTWFLEHWMVYMTSCLFASFIPLTFLHQAFSALVCAVISIPLTSLAFVPSSPSNVAPLSTVLSALNLCWASTVISIISVLNFSLAATLAIILGLPLSFALTNNGLVVKLAKYAAYVCLAFGWMIGAPDEAKTAIWNWEILGVWFAPFVCIVYTPLVLQAGIACLLP